MTQDQAISLAVKGHNIFLTGKAGTGKTYTLNKIIEALESKGKRVAKTASTGIAATHISGKTIHSWASIGIKESLTSDELFSIVNNRKARSRIDNVDCLIIDEISMIHDYRLDLVDEVLRYIKKNKKSDPFGGIQVILCGDFFQLPPVSKGSKTNYTFNSKAWGAADFKICYLEKIYRQSGDTEFVDILNNIRANAVTQAQKDRLHELKLNTANMQKAVNLYCKNVDVDFENNHKLKKLVTAYTYNYKYEAITGEPQDVKAITNNWNAKEELELKVGAKVMFLVNEKDGKYQNGTLGEVVDFKRSDTGESTLYPVVEVFKTGARIIAKPHEWKLDEINERTGVTTVKAIVRQVPLKLAWAITIHKAQGCTFDYVNLDMADVFVENMGYVALSRITSLDGLYLKSFNFVSMRTDINIINKYVEFQAQSIEDEKYA